MTKPKQIYTALISLILLVWVLYATTAFINTSSLIESQKNEEDLRNISQNNVNTIQFLFTEFGRSLTIAARGIEANKEFNDQELLAEFLEKVVKQAGFLCVAIESPNGILQTACNVETSYTSSIFFGRLGDKNILFSDVHIDKLHNKSVVTVKIPMEGSFSGFYLSGSVSTMQLSEMFDKSFMTAGGYYHMIDGNGTYVATSNSGAELLMDTSFLDAIHQLDFDEGYNVQLVLEAFTKKTHGLSKYSINGAERYMYYMPIGINDWVLTSILPKEEIEKITAQHQRSAGVLITTILIILGIIFTFVIIEEKKNQSESLIMQKSFQSLANQTNKVILEWDYLHHTFTSISDYASVFGRKLSISDIRADFTDSALIHKEDQAILRSIFDTILRGENTSGNMFRIQHKDGRYIWSSFSSIVVKNTGGKPIKALAFLEDVDDEVRHTEALKKTAELDSLTGVYNKAQTESLIAYELKNQKSSLSALFIMDYDNFKPLNDTFGHIKGDEVLKETTNGLKQIFRSDDIIGRIGGDEFFVYFKDVGHIEAVKAKADTLCNTLKKTYTEGASSVEITYSVGIALVPEHGTDLKALYAAADKALYYVKANGKNGYQIYDDKLM